MMRLSELSDLKAGRPPALAIGEVPEVARAQSIQEGDLIVAARGSATDICMASEPVFGAFVSLDLYLVRPDATKIDSQYLYAFLTLPATQALFTAGKQGSGLARLPKEALEKTKVPVPAMDVQRLIAGLACSFEEESKLLKKLSDLNSTLGREVVARAFAGADEKNTRRKK
jgi:restriction endonuclease S subunit